MKLFLRAGAVALICASFIGSASATDVGFGFKSGLNLSTTWGGENDEGTNKVMKPGLIIGAVWEVKLTDNFSIQPEALFSSKGIKIKAEVEGIETSSTLNMNYIEVPLLLKMNIPAGIFVPNFYAGPAIGFRAGVSGKVKAGDQKVDMPDEFIKIYKESTNLFDFGLAMGGGCNYTVGPGAVVLDIRYTLGLMKLAKLTDEDKDMGATASDLPKDKNGVLSFMIGYTFNIGG